MINTGDIIITKGNNNYYVTDIGIIYNNKITPQEIIVDTITDDLHHCYSIESYAKLIIKYD